MRGSLPDARSLRRALDSYGGVVERQDVDGLAELDRWFLEELPALIASRRPRHITLDELARLTEWKMKRGVWRGRNLALIRSNRPEEVVAVSGEAFARIPDARAPIAALSSLKGVGPATASAALSAAAPEVYPFFDEIVAEMLPLDGPLAWTPAYYRRYADVLRETARGMGDEWTPASLERALWSHAGGKAGAA